MSADTVMEIVSPLRRGVDIDAASRLRLDTDLLYSVVLRRVHDGIPFVHTTIHLPDEVAQMCWTSLHCSSVRPAATP